MPKKRKTKQEKVIADLRRKLETVKPEPATATSDVPTYSLPKTAPSPIKEFLFRQNTTISSHAYIFSDLKKTLILTIIAIASQIGLYFVLQR